MWLSTPQEQRWHRRQPATTLLTHNNKIEAFIFLLLFDKHPAPQTGSQEFEIELGKD